MAAPKKTFDEDKTEIKLEVAPQKNFSGYPCLELVGSSGNTKTRFPLASGKNSIGRSSENDIVLDDSSVSRRHALVELSDQGLFVSDLGSRNGTKVDAQKIQKSTRVPHGARIKVGVYELKFLEHEGSADNVVPLVDPKKEVVEEAPTPVESPAPQSFNEEESVGDENQAFAPLPPLNEGGVPSPEPETSGNAVTVLENKKKKIFYGVLSLGLVLALLWGGMSTWKFVKNKWVTKKNKKVESTVTSRQVLPLSPSSPSSKNAQTSQTSEPAAAKPSEIPSAVAVPSVPKIQPVFLDVSSSPLPAKIYFGDVLIGVAPIRLSTSLTTGQLYEARAVFDLGEFGESQEKVRFSIPTHTTTSILPVSFEAKVGMFKINTLPRDAQVYLEGFIDPQDPTKSRTVRMSQFTFGQNIPIPHGRYILEIKKTRQLGNSKTYLDEVVYHREFVLDTTQTNYTLEVKDEDLKNFPVEITSQPTGASVFLDDKEIGITPLKTLLPTGDHNLALRKEGYFDNVQPLRMAVNMPVMTDVVMKTSEAGELINKADVFVKEERFQEALPVLVEAFSKNPTPRETAQISYLVGICYLRQKSLPGYLKDARDYFNKAMLHEDFKFFGKIGIASVSFEEGDKNRALQLVVEILTSSEDPKVRSDAGALFQRISPLNSVLYVTSEPVGARVYVNSIEMPQQTPLIIHDLGVGTFRIQAHKDGFQEAETKIPLGVSEFKPIVIKLTPN